MALFPRVLLDNATWYMAVSWLGFGTLAVSHFPTGRYAPAAPWVKSHFFRTVEALGKRGVPIQPDNAIVRAACIAYAKIILSPEDLFSRTILEQEPWDVSYHIIEATKQGIPDEWA